MLFNSIEFAIFLPVVFILYWFLFNKNLKLQNVFLLVVSYIFYGWWDWRFLFLIAFSTIVDYSIGLLLDKTDKVINRKGLLAVSLIVNLGLLGFFKYYNFFIDSFVDAFTFFGNTINPNRLDIILPVGISFYTFQTLSYTIDIYRKQLKPTSSFVDFGAFVSFFPQLVAGPIERASNLLPQFYQKRIFVYNKAIEGLKQILWGFFAKIVIADNCANYVNNIFNDYSNLSGSTLFYGALLFTFQIYGDFSGYSNIAIGTSKLFGFDLMTNFKTPYFSRDIAEFWRRWHISLSTWFRDYLYIPLGGSRGTTWKKVRNIFVIFLVSGFWHGANWTFILWGFLNALYFLPLLLLKQNRKNTNEVAEGRLLPNFKEVYQIGITFFLTVIAWIFFRAESIGVACNYISHMFTSTILSVPSYLDKKLVILIILFVIIEWIDRESNFTLKGTSKISNRFLRYTIYYSITFLVLYYAINSSGEQQFIYFQF